MEQEELYFIVAGIFWVCGFVYFAVEKNQIWHPIVAAFFVSLLWPFVTIHYFIKALNDE